MLRAKLRGAFLLLTALGFSPIAHGRSLTAPIASYEISCRLDPDRKTVTGSQVLTWTNRTTRPAATLQFHLYLNAFRNTLSTFWREHRGRPPSRAVQESWGSIELTRLTLSADGTDLLPALRFIAPDDGNPYDRTVAEVDLPRAVAPGETISVNADFVSKLPRVSTRTGYKGDFFLVAQWFPKIGVLEESGWNCHQFHFDSEFFADFGDYDVTIEAPARYKGRIGATGVRVSERETSDGRVFYRFRQESVHDFAWTADPDFRLLHDIFREPGIGDVDILLFLQPEHLAQAERHFKAIKAGLEGFGRVLGPYPYPTLTVVDPPWGAGGAGGMEYPTFVVVGTSLIAPASIQSPEEVTIHEFGHQYFYGLLASNEFEEPWLDEGFVTYMTDRVVKAAYGDAHSYLTVFGVRMALGIDVRLPLDDNRRYFRHAIDDPLGIPSWKYRGPETYAALVYSKTGLALATIERLVGTPNMDRALRLYADRWRFRHPKTGDFIAALSEVTGKDVKWLFDRTFFSSGTIDYGVLEASSVPAKPPRGLFEKDGKLSAGPPAPLARAKGYDTLVTVVRNGDVALPVDILLRFEGGRTFRSSWDGEARWKRFRVTGGPRLLEALVDPDEKILLDADRTNNGRRPEGDPRAASRWTARAVFWLQNLFDFATVAW
ncbi:MAG TPA: M1 family metallopeptidase [Thermoanaerobaculia bacterium]|nr:M1 family metallopeptidase [Thermoanaerobaculia bacterium]